MNTNKLVIIILRLRNPETAFDHKKFVPGDLRPLILSPVWRNLGLVSCVGSSCSLVKENKRNEPTPSPQTSLYCIVKVHCLCLRLETQTKTSINILKAHLLTAELFHSVPWLNYLCTNYIFSLITSGTSLGRLPIFLHPTVRYYLEKLHTRLVLDDVWSKRPLIQPAAVSPPKGL